MSFPRVGARAVVTGAGSGLGRAFCRELVRRGARVMAADISLEAARETATLAGGQVHPVRCDVSSLPEVEALGAEADQVLGGVDLVINNAGVGVGGRVGEIPPADWEWIVGVNQWGVVHGCHVFVPRLRRQGSGHIINTASAAGLLCPPLLGPYNMTKAAVIALSETLAQELELDGTGVGVSVLCPTFFRTNIHKSARATDRAGLDAVDKLMEKSKLQAEDVARIALDGAQAGERYVLPHNDGRWLWRMKRWLPERYLALAPKAIARFSRS
jgi:NAD(P)-dependent dehydrogenase (short-subunit alcohol dehydrogenase family)